MFLAYVKGEIDTDGLPAKFLSWVKYWMQHKDINPIIAVQIKDAVTKAHNTNPVLHGFMLLLGNLLKKWLEPKPTGMDYIWYSLPENVHNLYDIASGVITLDGTFTSTTDPLVRRLAFAVCYTFAGQHVLHQYS
jgi:hypothetical protein